eukprot:COSAG03_NODE_1734_length_3585_cov_4.810152_4_plen_139_part_00
MTKPKVAAKVASGGAASPFANFNTGPPRSNILSFLESLGDAPAESKYPIGGREAKKAVEVDSLCVSVSLCLCVSVSVSVSLSFSLSLTLCLVGCERNLRGGPHRKGGDSRIIGMKCFSEFIDKLALRAYRPLLGDEHK